MCVNTINEMYGQTINKIIGGVGSEELYFINDKNSFCFYHSQDCCESVSINDIIGDLDDLIGSPIVLAEEVSNEELLKEVEDDCNYESYTWTFYRFGTVKGTVTVRWLGVSNGYYSEGVSFRMANIAE